MKVIYKLFTAFADRPNNLQYLQCNVERHAYNPPSDGNCFFASVEHQLASQCVCHSHKELRRDLAAYLSSLVSEIK